MVFILCADNFGNKFSWSNSRHDLFEECKRKYFYEYYGFWNGWKDIASEEARTLYRLKQLDNRYMWKGNTVHDAIAFLLKSRLHNKKINFDDFRNAVVERMRNQYRESLREDFKRDPKNKFGLLEHEYNEDIAEEEWSSNRDSILESIENFRNSPFWTLADELDFEGCLALEGDLKNPENIWTSITPNLSTFINLPYEPSVDHFFIDELKVWAKLDFAYPEGAGSIRIVDWKSSYSDEKPNPMQLNIYGYYASEEWNIPEDKIKLTVYNVAREERHDREFSKALKEKAKESILKSVYDMKSFLIDPAENQAREEDFPKIENDKICRHCRYRRVCKPELVN